MRVHCEEREGPILGGCFTEVSVKRESTVKKGRG